MFLQLPQTNHPTKPFYPSNSYWNWALDWESIPSSPIFSVTTGFGGTGSASSSNEEEILSGHCVTTGPFANLRVLYLDETLQPHCLSRGFVTSEEELVRLEKKVSPEAVERFLEMPDYDAFNIGLEEGSHAGIPYIIRGDFSLFTAPFG